MHTGQDLAKFEKSVKNKEIVGLLNYMDLLKEKIDFFLEKQKFYKIKNDIIFHVKKII